MDKTIESAELDLVDLGAASVETKGGPLGTGEAFQEVLAGLSDD